MTHDSRQICAAACRHPGAHRYLRAPLRQPRGGLRYARVPPVNSGTEPQSINQGGQF